jgi:hypothetical protein
MGPLSPLVLVLAAACNGINGGNCTTCPPPPVTLSIVAKQVTPAFALEGDTLRISGTVRASDSSDAAITISYNGIVATGTNTASGSQLSSHTGYVLFVGTKAGSDPVRDSVLVVVGPLTVTGTTPTAETTVGAQIGYALTAPTGTDSVAVDLSDGRRFVFPGISASTQIVTLVAGTLTLTPNAYNGSRWQTGNASTVNVTGP